MNRIALSLASLVLALAMTTYAHADDHKVAMDGKCPVCLIKMQKVVDGNDQFTSTYDGRTYRFPSADQKRMFDADPVAFVPVLGGDCTVCLIELGKRIPGSHEHALVHESRLYLFPEAKQLKMFQDNPDKYEDADLALDGACPVCLVNLDKVVTGSEKYAAIHDGMRYLFPGEMQRAAFQKNPAAFTPALGGDCTVCQVEMNKKVAGRAEFHASYDGRLYLFPGKEQLRMFKENPRKYADADLALDGHCPVCKVEMGKDVPGKPGFAVDYMGRRYLFPNAALRDKFNAQPAKYVGN